MRIPLLTLCALALAGCVSMSAAECSSANWYDVGYRDAIFRMRPQDVIYGHQCSQHNVQIDAASYAKGWREGNWEADQRGGMSID